MIRAPEVFNPDDWTPPSVVDMVEAEDRLKRKQEIQRVLDLHAELMQARRENADQWTQEQHNKATAQLEAWEAQYRELQKGLLQPVPDVSSASETAMSAPQVSNQETDALVRQIKKLNQRWFLGCQNLYAGAFKSEQSLANAQAAFNEIAKEAGDLWATLEAMNKELADSLDLLPEPPEPEKFQA